MTEHDEEVQALMEEQRLPVKVQNLDDPENFINRELSSLEFNKRVMEEAMDSTHPLLERIKFLAICGSNLDEFFMSRVSDLRRQMVRGNFKFTADGMTPSQTIDKVRQNLIPILKGHGACWYEELLPLLKGESVHVHSWGDLDEEQSGSLRQLFEREIYPTLTPLAFDAWRPFPFISNLTTNLAVIVKNNQRKDCFARVKVPVGIYPRFVPIPEDVCEDDGISGRPTLNFILLEDLISANLDVLFPGLEVVASYPFRITRDAEISIQLEDSSDLLTAVEEGVENRRVGSPVRLEVGPNMPEWMVEMLAKKLDLPKYLVFQSYAPIGLVDFWQMLSIDRPELKDRTFAPYIPPDLANPENVLEALKAHDCLLFHPYDSFGPVVNMLQQAANDPDVLAIKITLYRIDKHSPVIDALIQARKNGKQVAAVVELKAKFDEENNISFARTLEQEGVHVVYGPLDLKVHAKICLIVKKEKKGIVRYSHLGTGNYNNVTTKLYGDLGYITTNAEIGTDVSNLFNALTGYSQTVDYRKLLVAPQGLRSGIIERIYREIDSHHECGNGHIIWKMNGLLDKDIIKALYQASQEGVKVDLNVRGLCSLRPGMKGLSENIEVTSIVGRFLEHSRIYYFRNGGKDEVLIGSSDMMPRNLDRRVEMLFPVQDEHISRSMVKNILSIHLKDNVKARRLLSDGSYERVMPKQGEGSLDSQKWFLENRGVWHDRV
jgi:polyphosphate kinase